MIIVNKKRIPFRWSFEKLKKAFMFFDNSKYYKSNTDVLLERTKSFSLIQKANVR